MAIQETLQRWGEQEDVVMTTSHTWLRDRVVVSNPCFRNSWFSIQILYDNTSIIVSMVTYRLSLLPLSSSTSSHLFPSSSSTLSCHRGVMALKLRPSREFQYSSIKLIMVCWPLLITSLHLGAIITKAPPDLWTWSLPKQITQRMREFISFIPSFQSCEIH